VARRCARDAQLPRSGADDAFRGGADNARAVTGDRGRRSCHRRLALIIGAERGGAPAGERVSPWQARDAFRVNLPARQTLTLAHAGAEYPLEVTREHAGCGCARSAPSSCMRRRTAMAGSNHQAGHAQHVDVYLESGGVSLWRGARRIDFALLDPREVMRAPRCTQASSSHACPAPWSQSRSRRVRWWQRARR